MNPDRDINATCQEAAVKVQEVKLAVTTAGANPFELYDNLLSNEARQSWETVIKSQVMKAPWEDVFGNTHTKNPTKTWDSFHDCVVFHLQTVL